MEVVYSTYDAKAKFSEILRRVRAGQRVLITYRGETVAEVRPIGDGGGIEDRLRRAEGSGTVSERAERRGQLRPLAKREGGLRRFLESRD
jgi:prevent-host-death family protein